MNLIPRLRLLALLAALTAAGIGGFALATWAPGHWHLATFGPDYIPMAPVTALLFALLGLALAASLRWPGSLPARFAVRAGAFLALALGGLVLLQSGAGLALPWDRWFAGPLASVKNIPVGRMSPVTALAFLFTAAALLGQGRAARPLVRRAAALANSAALLTGLVVALSYATGTPLFYAGGIVPMALLTALAFVALNGSLFFSDQLDPLVRQWRIHDTAPHAPAGNRRFTQRLILATGVLGGLIVLAGIFYLRREQAATRAVIYEQLNAIARLKAEEISTWRNERLGEARFLLRTPAVHRDVAAFAATPGDPEARARVIDWLEPIKAGDRYASISVLDAGARPLLSIPAGPAVPVAPASFAEALASREPIFVDLQRDAGDSAPHLDLLVPIRPRPAARQRPDPPVAVIVLRLDPRHFLYPLVQNWPLPSATAETVLARQEGAEVVFLNELRHRPGAALTLRRPVSDQFLPAAQAARGQTGVGTGVDYRGVAVLASTRLIPGTPWILIAKLDQAEAYAPIVRDALQTGLAVVLLLFAVVLTGTSLWRWRHADALRRALAAEQERQVMAERLDLVMRHANDCIFLLDETGRILDASDRALTTYGYTADELRALPPGGLRPRGAAAELSRQLHLFDSPAGALFETLHQHKDGSVFPVEVSGRRVVIDGRPHLLGIYRDITQRKAHEAEIERLNRMYFVISQVNQALVRARDEGGLFAEVCRVLVTAGQFRIAWVGRLNPATQLLEPVAVAGDEHGYAPQIRISADATVPEGRGPSGTAFREGRTYVCNDFFADPATAPWRGHAARSGFRSSIALPLRCEGRTVGLLTVYAAEREFFQAREIELMEETAGDVSFALDVFAGEAKRRAAEAAVQASEQRLQFLLTATPAIIYSLRTDGSFATTFLSPNIRAVLGYAPEAAASPEFWRARVHPEDAPAANAAVAELIGAAGPDRIAREYRFRHADGSWRWMHDETRVVRDAAGRPRELVGYWIDVTARHQAELARRESEAVYHALVEQLPAGVFRKDPAGRYVFVSPWFCALKGMKAEDFLGRTPQEVAGGEAARQDTSGRAVKHAADGGDHHRQLMAGGPPIEMVEEYPLPDGRRQYVHVIKSPVVDREGKVIGTQGILIDITAGKRAEEALRREQALLHDLITTIPDRIYYKDRQSRFVRINQSMARLFGLRDPAEAVGTTDADYLARDHARVTYTEEQVLMASGQPIIGRERKEAWPDGRTTWVSTTKVPIRDGTGRITGLVGITRDITEQKLLEEKFLRAQRLESLGMLAAGIAHDLNNILAPIMFAAPMLRDSLSAPRDLKLLDTLAQSAGRGSGLVKQILEFVHSTAGEFQTVQLKHIARDIIGMVEETFPKSIQFTHQMPPDLWLVQCNPTQIHQVLLNLCVNARDAMPQGGTLGLTAANRRLDAAAAAGLAGGRPGDWVVLTVSDTGTGIPPELQEKVWTPFFTTKGLGQGTGLGLSTVRGIVTNHHGFITLDTAPGRGTTFRVFLPAVEPGTDAKHSGHPFAHQTGNGELILVVDDDDFIRNLVATILAEFNYQALKCADGVEALELFKSQADKIDLVITDIDMPRMDGTALAAALKEIRPALPLIAISGLGHRAAASPDLPTMRSLAGGFLLKPFKAEELLTLVHQLLPPAGKP